MREIKRNLIDNIPFFKNIDVKPGTCNLSNEPNWEMLKNAEIRKKVFMKLNYKLVETSIHHIGEKKPRCQLDLYVKANGKLVLLSTGFAKTRKGALGKLKRQIEMHKLEIDEFLSDST